MIWVVAAAFVLCVGAVQAQQSLAAPANPPTMDNVLVRVQKNYDVYLHTVPDLLAEEHVVSTVAGRFVREKKTKSDSIFRLRRGVAADHTIELNESREPKTMKDREQQVDGPSMISGVFSYAQLDLSPELKGCYEYRLAPDTHRYNVATLVVEYKLKPGLPTYAKCPVQEPVSGRAYIDAATMQILRMEQELPKHDVYRGSRGVWTWSIDYAPVMLGGKQFWLPNTISSRSSADKQDIVWTYVATYSKYHLLEVHSKILPAPDAGAPAH